MHVGFDLLFLAPGRTGGRETYAREIVTGVRRLAPSMRTTAFVPIDAARAGAGWWTEAVDRTVVLSRASPDRRAAWAAAEVLALPRAASRAGVDVLHSPANFAPVTGRFARVLSLHDLLFRHRPELQSPLMRWGTEALVVPAARRATRVLAPSRWSARRLVADLGVAAERVETVLLGISPPPAGADARGARERLGEPDRPIALAVATDLPHKNHAALVRAVATLDPAVRPLLVIAGAGTDEGSLPNEVERHGLGADVRLVGRVPDGELEDLYAAASVFVTATLNEGFGLPVGDALARGVPVVCSDLEVLREVAGEAALYVDPRDPRSIAAGIVRALAGGAEGERRRTVGARRAAELTWERTVRATLDVYERALADRRR